MSDINTRLIECIFKLSRFMKEDLSCDSDIASLTMLQLQAILYIKKHANAQMSEIAQHFAMELPSATSIIKTLVKFHLVSRHQDEKDRRLVRIALTDKALSLLQKTLKSRQQKIAENLSYLSSNDKTTLLKILEKMLKKMEEGA